MSAEEIVALIESLRSEVIRLKAVESYAQAVHWTVEASDRELAEHDDTRKAARLRELDAEKGLLTRGYVFLPPNDALFGNEMFPPELLTRAIAPAWEDCPTGTIAYSHTGTNWTKQPDGWWRAKGGDAFPTPGADACLVRLPNVPDHQQPGNEL